MQNSFIEDDPPNLTVRTMLPRLITNLKHRKIQLPPIKKRISNPAFQFNPRNCEESHVLNSTNFEFNNLQDAFSRSPRPNYSCEINTPSSKRSANASPKRTGRSEEGILPNSSLKFKGCTYVGEKQEGCFHGKGSLLFPSGHLIEANFTFGEAAFGKVFYPNGQVYIGELRNFKRHGKGHLFFVNGGSYEGQFEAGQITGFGQYTKETEKILGHWRKGLLISHNRQKSNMKAVFKRGTQASCS